MATTDVPGTVHPDLEPALFTEVARKAAVCWLSYPTTAAPVVDRLAWCAWHDGALLLLSGPGEQQLPEPAPGAGVEVALRSAHTGGLLVRRTCAARTVGTDDPEWDACARALLAGRLNHGSPEETLERWRASSTVLRLDP